MDKPKSYLYRKPTTTEEIAARLIGRNNTPQSQMTVFLQQYGSSELAAAQYGINLKDASFETYDQKIVDKNEKMMAKAQAEGTLIGNDLKPI